MLSSWISYASTTSISGYSSTSGLIGTRSFGDQDTAVRRSRLSKVLDEAIKRAAEAWGNEFAAAARPLEVLPGHRIGAIESALRKLAHWCSDAAAFADKKTEQLAMKVGEARTDGGTRDVTLIDFGSVGIVEKSLRRLLIPLLIAISNEDDAVATDLVLLICGHGEALNKAALQRDIGVVITRVHNSPTHENIFRLLLDALRRHRLAIPPSLLLVLRTLGSLEGTLRLLQPDYDLTRRGLELAPGTALRRISVHDMMMTVQSQGAVLVEGGEDLRGAPKSARLRSFASLEDDELELVAKTCGELSSQGFRRDPRFVPVLVIGDPQNGPARGVDAAVPNKMDDMWGLFAAEPIE